jgi:hypothetical protein
MTAEKYLRKFTRRAPLLEKIRRSAEAKGLDRLSLREINAEIKAYRRERSKKD